MRTDFGNLDRISSAIECERSSGSSLQADAADNAEGFQKLIKQMFASRVAGSADTTIDQMPTNSGLQFRIHQTYGSDQKGWVVRLENNKVILRDEQCDFQIAGLVKLDYDPGANVRTQLVDALKAVFGRKEDMQEAWGSRFYQPYTVQRGDTLSEIAQELKFALTDAKTIDAGVAELCAINGISNPNMIREGQQLWLSKYHQ